METIFLTLWGSLVAIELLVRIIQSTRQAPDILWYLCRPFGIPFRMYIACIVRILLIASGAIALYQGITLFINS